MGLDPDAVRVELYADPMDGSEPQRHTMAQGRALDGWDSGHEYAASVPASRPAGHYMPRLVPYHPEAGTPLEAPTSSGYDDHGDKHGNDHEMTTTTAGMMADGPLTPAGLRAVDPCW